MRIATFFLPLLLIIASSKIQSIFSNGSAERILVMQEILNYKYKFFSAEILKKEIVKINVLLSTRATPTMYGANCYWILNFITILLFNCLFAQQAKKNPHTIIFLKDSPAVIHVQYLKVLETTLWLELEGRGGKFLCVLFLVTCYKFTSIRDSSPISTQT